MTDWSSRLAGIECLAEAAVVIVLQPVSPRVAPSATRCIALEIGRAAAAIACLFMVNRVIAESFLDKTGVLGRYRAGQFSMAFRLACTEVDRC